jgi:plastocyanin
MKFSTASSVAIIAAFAPSLVSAANITVIVGASRNGQPGLVGFLFVKVQLESDPLHQVFDPQQVTAQRGDIVSFEFRGGNHVCSLQSPEKSSLSHLSLMHRLSPKAPLPTHAHVSRHVSAAVELLI